jgi:TonB family protein
MADQTGRTFICSVVFVDLVEYSRKSVAEQILLKETCNALIAEAIDAVPPDSRIVLDTGDGAAITFLGDPEDALFVGLKLRDSIEEALTSHSIGIGRHKANGHIRVGINLGPVKIATNVTGGANIVGDGIVVAERIMGFALPGQMLVSRSFYEMVSRLSDDYGSLFKHDGQRSDPNGRVHDLYLAGHDLAALATAERGARERKKVASGGQAVLTNPPLVRGGPEPAARPHLSAANLPPSGRVPAPVAATGPQPAMPEAAGAPAPSALAAFLEDRFKVGFVALLLMMSAAFLAFLLWQKKHSTAAGAAAGDVLASLPAPSAASPVTPGAAPSREVKAGVAPETKSAPPTLVRPAEKSFEKPAEKTVEKTVERPASADSRAAAKPQEKAVPQEKAPPPGSTAVASPASAPAPVAPAPAPAPRPAAIEKSVAKTDAPAPAAASEGAQAKAALDARPALPSAKPPAVDKSAERTAQKSAVPVREAPRREPAPPPAAQVPPSIAPQPVQPPAPALQVALEPAPKAPPTTAVRKLAGENPQFPPEAARARIDSGYVKVRLRLDADGVVASVDILESRPLRVFDRAVREALKAWKFNPGAPDRVYEAQIDFSK